MDRFESIHKGHRQRLKDKVKNNGLRALSEHEILELLLTYTIPYKDTNGLAHNLLGKYGSISAVIDAEFADLKTNNGVGDETALMLNILSQFVDVYKQDKNKQVNISINSTSDVVKFFRGNFDIKDFEQLHVICAGKAGKFLSHFTLRGMNDCQIDINTKDFVNTLNSHNPNMVVLIHTHPKGNVLPSNEDIVATEKIYQICSILGIHLADHIIINETEHFSFGSNGLMDKICNQTQFVKDIKFGGQETKSTLQTISKINLDDDKK